MVGSVVVPVLRALQHAGAYPTQVRRRRGGFLRKRTRSSRRRRNVPHEIFPRGTDEGLDELELLDPRRRRRVTRRDRLERAAVRDVHTAVAALRRLVHQAVLLVLVAVFQKTQIELAPPLPRRRRRRRRLARSAARVMRSRRRRLGCRACGR